MAKQHMKICSPSLAIKEMQIKTTLRFYLTPVRIASIKNTTTTKYWWGCVGKGTPIHWWWECKLVQPLWKTRWRRLKKLNIDLPYDPAIPFLGIYWVVWVRLLQKQLQTVVNCSNIHSTKLCGIYTQWNFTQPQRRIKLCYSQVNGWNWRTSS
jgi:hypothetical protein